MEEKEEKGSNGKRPNQRLKTYILMQYLLRHTDKQHPVGMRDILDYLNNDCGIDADRRTIYKDLAEINHVLFMLDNEDCSIEDAIEELKFDDSLKYVVSDGQKSGYYIARRPYNLDQDDVRLLAECVYTARFVKEKKAAELVDVICACFSNEWQELDIKHDALLIDRVKTQNTKLYSCISKINTAMRQGTKNDPHTPEKITFRYQKYSIEDVSKTVDRRQGAAYKVSPYRLLINEGNYYLLAFDDKSQAMRTYRVDRMKAVKPTGEPRDGQEEFDALDLQNYTQRVFGMFGGKRVRVTLRFTNDLLDTVIDRFGTKDTLYSQYDNGHFTAAPEVELSKQFFSWLCGFGNKVKIIGPEFVIEEFTAFLDKIRCMY